MVDRLREEPASEGVAEPTPSRTCPSCGEYGAGAFCSACGRPMATRTPTFRDMAVDAVQTVGGLERRLWRTLVPLVSRPGFLTAEHRDGRGGRYLSPVQALVAAGAVYAGVGYLGDGIHSVLTVNGIRINGDWIGFLATPLLAVILFAGHVRSRRAFGEFLAFACYFQAAQFLAAIVAGTIVPGDLRPLFRIGYMLFYLAEGPRRLWNRRRPTAWLASLGFALAYLGTTVAAFVALMAVLVR